MVLLVTKTTLNVSMGLRRYFEENSANDSKYLVGDRYTVADYALFGWAYSLHKVGIDIHDWPLLGKWFDALNKDPAVIKGVNVPEKNKS